MSLRRSRIMSTITDERKRSHFISQIVKRTALKPTRAIGLVKCFLVTTVYWLLIVSKLAIVPHHGSSNNTLEPYDSEHFLVMLSKNRTYTGDCKSRYLYNKTWGKSVARFVDKLAAKQVLRQFNVAGLKIVPTITYYDETNISSFTLDAFLRLNSGNGAIIKPIHTSGGVAMIYNNTYHCFKRCKRLTNSSASIKKIQHSKISIPGNETLVYFIARSMIEQELESLYIRAEIETQYQFISRGIIIEERLRVEDMMEYHWWVVNGHPVFVCIRCNYNGISAGSYFTSHFRRLSIKMEGLPGCRSDMEQPKTWVRMVEMVKTLSLKLPRGIIRIDLYASDSEIYFSEFTYTSNGCKYYYDPLVADAFLYGALYEIFKPSQLTPTFIEAAINQRFFYIIPFMRHVNSIDGKMHNALQDIRYITAHPNDWTTCRRAKWQISTNATEGCFATLVSLDKKYPIRCIGVTETELYVIGQWRVASFWSAIERVDWHWAAAIGTVFLIFLITGSGAERKRSQMGTLTIYFAAVFVYKFIQPNAKILRSFSLISTIKENFNVFSKVHPITSPVSGWIHVATNWFQVAAWVSRTPRGVLFWYFIHELVMNIVHEYIHLDEEDRQLKCLRVSFIEIQKIFTIDDILRTYIISPMLVYFYLLPKLLLRFTPFGETM
jgi:TupA-like ATPgrasp